MDFLLWTAPPNFPLSFFKTEDSMSASFFSQGFTGCFPPGSLLLPVCVGVNNTSISSHTMRTNPANGSLGSENGVFRTHRKRACHYQQKGFDPLCPKFYQDSLPLDQESSLWKSDSEEHWLTEPCQPCQALSQELTMGNTSAKTQRTAHRRGFSCEHLPRWKY